MKKDIRNVFRVRDGCSLEYPNGECFARRGQYVYIDWHDPRYRAWLVGQASRIRDLTPEERARGVEVIPIDPKFLSVVPGFQVEQDRMFRLDQPPPAVVTKGSRHKPEGASSMEFFPKGA